MCSRVVYLHFRFRPVHFNGECERLHGYLYEMTRNKSAVWLKFECVSKTNNTGKWAKCKKCGIEMQGIPSRMENHLLHCDEAEADAVAKQNSNNSHSSTSKQVGEQCEDETSQPAPAKRQKTSLNITRDTEVISTSPEYATLIDRQIGRYFYATNTAFNHADIPEFKLMVQKMRPGYKTPSSRQLAGPILEHAYDEVTRECKEKLEGETVSMCLDGWSNVHNESLVCCSIVTGAGLTVLAHTEDTSGNAHTANYLKEVALKVIESTEEKFGVKIGSFVTDNAANVEKMRKDLNNDVQTQMIIQYGCSAHILNLLAHDVDVPAITANILKVIKYFRNKHLPAALYKKAQGKKLIMPLEIRWNTMNEAIKSFLENRGILVQLCQDHRQTIDADISKIVNDMNIVTNASDLMDCLNPIATALDRTQRDNATISVAVEVWKSLEEDLENKSLTVKRSFYKRRDMALGGPHYLANMLDHRFLGERLSNLQKEQVYAFLNDVNPELVPFVIALITKSKPFPKFMFGGHFKNTAPLIWWKSLTIQDSEWPDKKKFVGLYEQLLTAIGATAGLERYFSTFGLVQSKLRNRLGNEKAGKLVFIFKYLNQNPSKKRANLQWIWPREIQPTLDAEESDASDQDDNVPLSRYEI